jgi:hypothetical protein
LGRQVGCSVGCSVGCEVGCGVGCSVGWREPAGATWAAAMAGPWGGTSAGSTAGPSVAGSAGHGGWPVGCWDGWPGRRALVRRLPRGLRRVLRRGLASWVGRGLPRGLPRRLARRGLVRRAGRGLPRRLRTPTPPRAHVQVTTQTSPQSQKNIANTCQQPSKRINTSPRAPPTTASWPLVPTTVTTLDNKKTTPNSQYKTLDHPPYGNRSAIHPPSTTAATACPQTTAIKKVEGERWSTNYLPTTMTIFPRPSPEIDTALSSLPSLGPP